ncbi:MAG: protease modulator HflC [Candidatus Auribacterota bacterium]
MKKNYLTISIAALLTGVLLLFLVAFQVSVNQCAVITTFGKPTRSIKEPGLYWKLPWPFQKSYIFDSRIMLNESVFEETYTKDGKNIIFSVCVGWNIEDAEIFLKSIGTLDDAQRNIEGLVRTYKNGVLGQHNFSSLISTSEADLQFDTIEHEILTPVAAEAAERYGIKVSFLYITRLGLPEETTVKVFERMKKERERIAEQFRSEGEARATEIKAKAHSERDQVIAKAEAEAKRIRGEGDAAAAEYYAIFEEHTELAVFLKKLETLREILKQRSTVILDTSTPPFDLLNTIEIPTKHGDAK